MEVRRIQPRFLNGGGCIIRIQDNHNWFAIISDSNYELAESEAAEKAGLTLEIKDIDGGPQLNTATVDEEVDVNAQSWALSAII